MAEELEGRLQETGKTSEYLELGYSIDQPKKKKEYKKSWVSKFHNYLLVFIKYVYILTLRELRLVESLDGLCERILKYNIHKERTDSTRFAKGMSQTFQTLHGLV